jgi:hypothetical protein
MSHVNPWVVHSNHIQSIAVSRHKFKVKILGAASKCGLMLEPEAVRFCSVYEEGT